MDTNRANRYKLGETLSKKYLKLESFTLIVIELFSSPPTTTTNYQNLVSIFVILKAMKKQEFTKYFFLRLLIETPYSVL